jgi:phosphatidylethanolamine/phosphatidyl-N-methylethanolamine N-methyltransferase
VELSAANRRSPENEVERVYERLAPVYDLIFGTVLQPGRRRAMARLAPRGGEAILEVGVGTGFGLRQYPAGCRVTGIDLSASMIDVARDRTKRQHLPNVSLSRMDAALLAFADRQFDAVYAPYVMNVVPDPIRVAGEMRRVCRTGGRLVFLNHFSGITVSNPVTATIGRVASRVAGVNWQLDFDEFMRATGLEPASIEPVNAVQVSAVVLCRV